jgi:predicted acetyltransferase
MELVLPSVDYKDSYIEAVKEQQTDHSFPLMERTYDKLSIPELEATFDDYVEKKKSESRGENLPEGWVPATTYWLVDRGEYIGNVSIRHQLIDRLMHWGGHIGYTIRPSARGKGYGSAILELAIPKAKELGIERILVTCDATNTASRKIIEKNGGVLENQVPNPETGVDKLRFWIEL